MKKINIKLITRQVIYSLVGVATMLAYFPAVASAAAITGRSVVLSTSAGDAAGVTYTLATAALPSTTVVKSMEIKFCTSLSGSCTAPSGFSASSSTLTGTPTGLGTNGGFTVSAATAGSLRISNTTNAVAPTGAVQVVWGGVHNPTAANATFYGIITTYSDAAWTTAIDTGSIALSTAGQITVNASVDETLTFTLAAATIDLGHLSPSTAGTDGTHTMVVGTNAKTGYTVKYAGNTLTSASADTIAALSGANYAAGTPGFGFNLAANTTPASLGAAATGGSGTASTGYGTPNQFKFLTGDPIAQAAGPSADTTYTLSFAAAAGSATPAGAYTTVLGFTATANF